MRVGFSFAITFAAMLAGPRPVPAASLALVMAVDVSESVSPERYALQHDGIARAFETPKLIDAISASGGIEALVLEWSDPDKIAITVGWTKITNREEAARFATAVRATQRTSHGLTAIGAALQAAGDAFTHLPEPATHQLVDVSGYGIANFGPPPAAVRDKLVAQGVTINGLAILTEEPWLADYYKQNVIGGPGAFCLVAENMDSFAEAMLEKLAQEVAGVALSRHPRASGGPGAIVTSVAPGFPRSRE